MTIVIAVLNQKGGVGKTTIASNLGESFRRAGKSILLIDADPQGSLRDWNEASEQDILPVIGLDRKSIEKDLNQFKDNYDLVIIDGAPQSGTLAGAAIACADLVIIPVTPSPYDVWACSEIVELIERRQVINNGQPKAYFLISRAMNRTKLGDEVGEALTGYNLPVLKSKTIHRQIYAQTASEGLTVFHGKNASDAINDVENIRIEIEGILSNGATT